MKRKQYDRIWSVAEVLTCAVLLPNAGLCFVVRVGGARAGEKQ